MFNVASNTIYTILNRKSYKDYDFSYKQLSQEEKKENSVTIEKSIEANSSNCWKIPSGQSAAKPYNLRKVQRLSREGVEFKRIRSGEPQTSKVVGEDIVYSLQQYRAVINASNVANLMEY